jgi:UDP-N-acetylglucosamine--N-acetylmuramyl-(pentapeptide) pyrophosphoryl-undecaprenol N-acetylglucosamine transferase
MPPVPHILFAGGGTAGSLYPGLTVAEQLAHRMPQALISFAGPGRSQERYTIRGSGHQYLAIPSRPVPHSPWQTVRFVTDNVAGYCAARWLLREHQISLVVGLGGYTSAAVVRAAVDRGTPIILLEQNAIPGRTTRWLSRSSALVCAAFEEVRPHLHVQTPVKVTGNPARPSFAALHRRVQQGGCLSGATLSLEHGLPPKKRLVVLGGDEGARSLNESLPSALQQLGSLLDDWQVVHQTGNGQLRDTEERYQRLGVEALTVACIDEIASLLLASDLVVCRAGGTTLAELTLAGVPALLVPSQLAVDDHQIANAKVFSAAGACRLIDESSQEGALHTALACELKTLITGGELRAEMSRRMQSLARPQAPAEIADAICEKLCGARTELLAA